VAKDKTETAMSYRLNIAPAMPNSEVADWTISLDATPEQVDAVADECFWFGLRVFAPTADDWRLRRLMHRLEACRGVSPDDYDVYILEGGTPERGGWAQL
jgi:hypothetical protein